MDKYEYKLRAEEIKKLISQKKYKEAAQVADSIEWTRVKSVMMLCTVSDLYKVNRRFEEAKILLDMANERHPFGRMIIFSLCDLAIKMGEIVQAVEYYKDFVQIAPTDSSRYVLQYKIYEAQDVGLEERIAVLEELKKRDYREKWAYELAYLYHRVGLASKCVEECDDLILWFGEGKYVLKALELKMLHQALSPAQQSKFDMYAAHRQGRTVTEEKVQHSAEIADFPSGDMDMQAEDDMDIHVKPMDMGKYNTMNLQAELAESMKEVMQAGGNAGEVWQEPGYDRDLSVQEPSYSEPQEEQEPHETLLAMEDERYQHDVTRAMPDTEEWDAASPLNETEWTQEEQEAEEEVPQNQEIQHMDRLKPPSQEQEAAAVTYQEIPSVHTAVKSEERPEPDRQATGQLSIQDIMSEWERMKQENEERRRRQLKEKVLQQTGNIFSDFDKASRTGMLEGLQIKERVPVETAYSAVASTAAAAGTASALADSDTTKIWSARDVQEAARNSIKEAPELRAGEAAGYEVSGHDAVLERGRYETAPDAGCEDEDLQVDGYTKADRDDDDRDDYGTGQEEYASDDEDSEDSGEDAENEYPDNEYPAEDGETNRPRAMSAVEKKLFFSFVPTRGAVKQLTGALDKLSLTAHTGNMILTGETGSDYMQLAKSIVRVVRSRDHSFSGKMAKINGLTVNTKDASSLIGKIEGGALVIENAGEISQDGAQKLIAALSQKEVNILVILVDSRRMMKHLLEDCPELETFFNARFEIEALDNATLVEYGCQYARAQEYTIDEFGELALHTRIEDMQTSDHIVNIIDVRQIVDEAIAHANRKTPKHLVDVILGKRYGDDDMIVLHEKDFI